MATRSERTPIYSRWASVRDGGEKCFTAGRGNFLPESIQQGARSMKRITFVCTLTALVCAGLVFDSQIVGLTLYLLDVQPKPS